MLQRWRTISAFHFTTEAGDASDLVRLSERRSALLPVRPALDAENRRRSSGHDKYPDTRRVDQVDDYHGEKVADPYRWLEDDVRKSQEVADWVADAE